MFPGWFPSCTSSAASRHSPPPFLLYVSTLNKLLYCLYQDKKSELEINFREIIKQAANCTKPR